MQTDNDSDTENTREQEIGAKHHPDLEMGEKSIAAVSETSSFPAPAEEEREVDLDSMLPQTAHSSPKVHGSLQARTQTKGRLKARNKKHRYSAVMPLFQEEKALQEMNEVLNKNSITQKMARKMASEKRNEEPEVYLQFASPIVKTFAITGRLSKFETYDSEIRMWLICSSTAISEFCSKYIRSKYISSGIGKNLQITKIQFVSKNKAKTKAPNALPPIGKNGEMRKMKQYYYVSSIIYDKDKNGQPQILICGSLC